MTQAGASLHSFAVKWRFVIFVAITGISIPIANSTHAFADGPVLCPFRLLTGFPCPSCGTTRAVGALLQGDIATSIQLNPLGVLLVVAALWFVVSPTSLAAFSAHSRTHWRRLPLRIQVAIVVTVAALGWWRSLAMASIL